MFSIIKSDFVIRIFFFKVTVSFKQVDIRPFRQALLNNVRKWGNMYKEHLVNKVTCSLSDLGNFIRDADEGNSYFISEIPQIKYRFKNLYIGTDVFFFSEMIRPSYG